MKIHKYTVIVIIFSLFCPITGVTVTERSVQEGETFIFHLPNIESGRSVEWKQMNKLLAIISLDNNTVIFQQGRRHQFMQNGSVVIRDVKQEDTGNYTYNIIFKDKKIQSHILSLTLYSETTEQSPTYNSTFITSETTEQSPTYNSTFITSVPPALNKVQIVIIISSLGSLLLLGGVIVIVLKCRRKRRTQEEPIYSNMYYNTRTCRKKVTGDQKQTKS
ncbi:uncharacterized protein LOC108266545 isoform X1 [Ictalurus punctatus]|uniref:Uncharacterized protein LOC108266545 isoform X1 n=1 Tax=Ictalurus punctatus TaxID=7998 RepID=A0A2D0R4J7_ICTPU|nr:uncharacterized protein LOC108266545 isoform X1 [Ictalurus punctatus]